MDKDNTHTHTHILVNQQFGPIWPANPLGICLIWQITSPTHADVEFMFTSELSSMFMSCPHLLCRNVVLTGRHGCISSMLRGVMCSRKGPSCSSCSHRLALCFISRDAHSSSSWTSVTFWVWTSGKASSWTFFGHPLWFPSRGLDSFPHLLAPRNGITGPVQPLSCDRQGRLQWRRGSAHGRQGPCARLRVRAYACRLSGGGGA